MNFSGVLSLSAAELLIAFKRSWCPFVVLGEAQLLTNPRDAFREVSQIKVKLRSPNMVPFAMLGMVSSVLQ